MPHKKDHIIGLTSWTARRCPHLALFLDATPRYLLPGLRPKCAAIAGWGRKAPARKAQKKAQRHGLPFLTLEDGFLRSVAREDPPLSLICDDRGIYYDASTPSRLEEAIATPLSPEEMQRARQIINQWRNLRLSKYNALPDYAGDLPTRYILLFDQVAGDESIRAGLADAACFEHMLHCALTENPEAQIIIKLHPDLAARGRKGHFDPEKLETLPRVQIITEACHPVRLIEQAEAVYTVTSQTGFEALIWGKKLRCFGLPFYAGWGLSMDEHPAPPRRGKATLEQLVYAALVRYPRYIDPERGQRCEVETTMAQIGLQRANRQRWPQRIYALGFSRWKKPILRDFLAGSKICFVRRLAEISDPESTVAIWGNKPPPDAPDSLHFLHIEDGFLRSAGLGADLIRPLSWVIDDRGIYYDASRPSRLEELLQNTDFSADLLQRARKLRQILLSTGVSKYNLTGKSWQRPQGQARVILVAGQVETDASLHYGTGEIKTNLALLKAVRAAHPTAYILYKPHPDVVAGLRKRGQGETEAVLYCDEIITKGDPIQILTQVDELHSLTSLLGFEALIRNVPVTCYGQPFYAGWGLTQDQMPPLLRRSRRLSVEELIAGALILYPTYISRTTGCFTTPERTIEELTAWRMQDRITRPLWQPALRSILRTWRHFIPKKQA